MAKRVDSAWLADGRLVENPFLRQFRHVNGTTAVLHIEVAMLDMFVAVSFLSLAQAGAAEGNSIVIPGRPPIVQAVFNPDGRRLYFSTLAGVEGHDLETGKRLFDGPYGRELVCSPKGDLLAAVHINIGMITIGGTVDVLDAATGKLLHTETGTSASFSPDSRWLLSRSTYTWGRPGADPPPKLQITDLRTGKTRVAEVPSPKGAQFGAGPVSAHLDFTKDGTILVSRARDPSGRFTTVAACELETGKALAKLPSDEDVHFIRDLKYSADGKRFADAWSVFDVASGKAIAKLEPPKREKSDGWYPGFQLSADGKVVFSVTSSRREIAVDEKAGRKTLTMASHLHVWDADTGKWQKSIDARRVVTAPAVTLKKLGHFQNSEPRFAVNHQGSLAVDYDPDAVTVWDLATGKPRRTLRDVGPAARPEILRFSPDGKWLASAATSGEVAVWNAQTGQPGRPLDLAAHLGEVCFRPKSDELIGVGHGLIYVWDLRTGKLKQTFEQQGNLFRIECHRDGKLAAVSDYWSDSVSIIDIDTGKTLHRLTGRGKSLAFHPDNDSLLALDPHGTVAFWDIATGKNLKRWPGARMGDTRYSALRIGFVSGAARFLLCENDAVAIVDATSGKRVFEHPMKNEPADVDVHPDGKRFVVAFGGDKKIEERDVETGKVLRTYPGYPRGPSQVRYSRDGSRLATAGAYAYELRIHDVTQ
jgi:WD40 repeat protein